MPLHFLLLRGAYDEGTEDAVKFINIGEMVNKGLEFTLNAKILESENGLNWSLGGNISTLKNEVTKMYDENDIITVVVLSVREKP